MFKLTFSDLICVVSGCWHYCLGSYSLLLFIIISVKQGFVISCIFLCTDEVAKSTTSLESTLEKIDIPELLDLIGEKSHLWEMLAMRLFSDVDFIKRIKQDYDTADSRLFQVIGYWKNHDNPPFTWATVENEFRKLKQCSLANTIQRKYLTKNLSE